MTDRGCSYICTVSECLVFLSNCEDDRAQCIRRPFCHSMNNLVCILLSIYRWYYLITQQVTPHSGERSVAVTTASTSLAVNWYVLTISI